MQKAADSLIAVNPEYSRESNSKCKDYKALGLSEKLLNVVGVELLGENNSCQWVQDDRSRPVHLSVR